MCVFVCVCICVLSCVRLFVNVWAVAHQASLSMEFPSRESMGSQRVGHDWAHACTCTHTHTHTHTHTRLLWRNLCFGLLPMFWLGWVFIVAVVVNLYEAFWKLSPDISSKKTCRWPTGPRKDSQHCSSHIWIYI